MLLSTGFLLSLLGCGRDISFQRSVVPPAQPPGEEPDRGAPPDWQNCIQGWRGQYYNLTVDHPDVLPGPDDEPAGTDPLLLDWWTERDAFEDFEPTLDFGRNFWRVDEGLQGDPAYFSARFSAWIRAWSDTDVTVLVGSSDDAWVIIDGQPVVERPGIQPFERETYTFDLDAGVSPIDVFYAHRASDESGFSFRVVSGDISICYADFSEEEGQTR